MKPILFNQEMVKAILDNRKSCTRRLVKPQPRESQIHKLGYCIDGDKRDIGKFGFGSNEHGGHVKFVSVPFEVGDILYVRETFAVGKIESGEESDGSERLYISQCDGENDIIPKEYAIRNNIGVDNVIWKPSLFMPKEAARIFLKVTDVRVERLQDITEEQVIKEGISPYDDICQDERWKPTYNDPDSGGEPQLKQGFEILWNSTVKEDWQKFASNPWVWVIDFERISKEETEQEN